MKTIKTFENKKFWYLVWQNLVKPQHDFLKNWALSLLSMMVKTFDENPAAQSLLEEGIKVICGSHPLELLDENFELMVKNPGIRYDNPMVARAIEKNYSSYHRS